jgi:hypothetical protein
MYKSIVLLIAFIPQDSGGTPEVDCFTAFQTEKIRNPDYLLGYLRLDVLKLFPRFPAYLA